MRGGRSIVGVCTALFAVWSAPATAQTDHDAELAWISGCWQMTSGSATTVERWGDAEGRVILGTSKTVRDGQTVAWEHLRIEWTDDGASYWAYPSGQAPTTFRAHSPGADSVTFSNPDHDFPQSITYRGRPDSLVASIQGTQGDETRQVFFRYARIPCDA